MQRRKKWKNVASGRNAIKHGVKHVAMQAEKTLYYYGFLILAFDHSELKIQGKTLKEI